MWDDDKQQRLDALQRRGEQGTLTDDERQQVDSLRQQLEHGEWAALRHAMERLREEQVHLQADLSQMHAQDVILAALAERYADLLGRARMQLTGLVREREALRTDYERALQDTLRP